MKIYVLPLRQQGTIIAVAHDRETAREIMKGAANYQPCSLEDIEEYDIWPALMIEVFA